MKTKLLFICALCTFNLFAQTNLVPNGGFETWTNSSTLSDWTSENNVTQNPTFYSDGSKSLSVKLTVANSSNKPKIITQVPMVAGTTYTVKYKYKYISSNYSGLHPISLKIEKAGSATSLSSNVMASNNDWTLKETTFTADQNISYDLSFSLTTFDSEGFEVLIDDLQVYIQGTEQFTHIPDLNFEELLIKYNIDYGEPDGEVQTNSINKLTFFNVASGSINDLTGIQDFVSLTYLDCDNNNLSTLDLSKNIALTTLKCSNNSPLSAIDISKNVALTTLTCANNKKLTFLDVSNNIALNSLDCSASGLTALDVSKNTALKKLQLFGNKITTLDVSKNTALTSLNISFNNFTAIDVSKNVSLTTLMIGFNKLTTFDVSKNIVLTTFNCNTNNLTSLNLKNKNNVNFINNSFINNPNLTCIQVDDDAYSNDNWASAKDAIATYKTNCTALGIEDSVFDKAVLYPNPTKDEVTITNIALEKATVYNTLGQLVKSFTLSTGNTNNTISLAGLPKGVYYVYLINQNAASAKKVIVE